MYDEKALRQEYDSRRPALQRLADNLRHALRTFLEESNVDILDVTSRIKEFSSFAEKVVRKRYQNPFEAVHDLCGLRIIAFYPSDLATIDALIHEEFDVLESENKLDSLPADRFGYRSLHYVVRVKADWLRAPNYRGLGDFVAEIQLRTILMHAWADLSHKLAYKVEAQIPEELQRQVNQLSALFELADTQFDRLREARSSYRERLSQKAPSSEDPEFELDAKLNLDSLQAFLDFHFPSRDAAEEDTLSLFDDLKGAGVSLRDIATGYERIRSVITTQERESFSSPSGKWRQVGIVRQILDVTHDSWWATRRHDVPESVASRVEEQREAIGNDDA